MSGRTTPSGPPSASRAPRACAPARRARALAEARRALRLAGVPAPDEGPPAATRGHALRTLGRFAEAERAYRLAAASFTRAREPVETARCAIGRIDALMYLGRYALLRRVAAAALRRFARAGERAAAARLRNNLANLEYRLDRPEAALRLYAQARRVARARRPRRGRGSTRIAPTASCCADRRPPRHACCAGARATFAREGLALDVAGCDYALAYVQFLGHRYAEALFALAALEQPFERAGAEDFRALLDLDAAEIYLRLGRPADALVAADRALARSQALGLRMEAARAMLFGAVAQAARGELPPARRGLAAAARAFRRERNATGRGIADLARAEIDLSSGRASAAGRRAVGAAREFSREGDREREGMAWIVVARAELARSRRSPRARAAAGAAARRAQGCARAAGSRFLAFRVACLEGDLALVRADRAGARRAYLRAARLSESTAARVRGEMVRATDWSAWEDAYPRLVALEYAAGRDAALFRALERGRASAFERVDGSLPRDAARGRVRRDVERRLESIALRLEARGRGRAPFAAQGLPGPALQGEQRAVARELDLLDRLGTTHARAAAGRNDLRAARAGSRRTRSRSSGSRPRAVRRSSRSPPAGRARSRRAPPATMSRTGSRRCAITRAPAPPGIARPPRRWRRSCTRRARGCSTRSSPGRARAASRSARCTSCRTGSWPACRGPRCLPCLSACSRRSRRFGRRHDRGAAAESCSWAWEGRTFPR